MHLHNSTPSRPPGHPQLDGFADTDLLEFAAMRDEDLSGEDAKLAKEAFAELYRRHAVALHRTLAHSSEGQLYEQDVSQNLEPLVGQTFLRACESADTYDSEKAAVKTWLVSIAKNLIKDWLREEERRRVGFERFDTEDDEDLDRAAMLVLRDADLDASRFDEEEMGVLRDAMVEALTEHQWDYLTAYLAVQTDGETRGRADRGAVKRLAEIKDTTTNALRTNKSRAIGKIKEYIQKRMPERVPD
jgi:RNA polymerase sigma factor (sigma-70 family)